MDAVRLPDLEEDKECAVCMTPIEAQRSISTPCQHRFHATCLHRWVRAREHSSEFTPPTCPLCRGNIHRRKFLTRLRSLASDAHRQFIGQLLPRIARPHTSAETTRLAPTAIEAAVELIELCIAICMQDGSLQPRWSPVQLFPDPVVTMRRFRAFVSIHKSGAYGATAPLVRVLMSKTRWKEHALVIDTIAERFETDLVLSLRNRHEFVAAFEITDQELLRALEDVDLPVNPTSFSKAPLWDLCWEGFKVAVRRQRITLQPLFRIHPSRIQV